MEKSDGKTKLNVKCECCDARAATLYNVNGAETPYCERHAAVAAEAAAALAKLNLGSLVAACGRVDQKPEPCGVAGCGKPSTTVHKHPREAALYFCTEHARKAAA